MQPSQKYLKVLKSFEINLICCFQNHMFMYLTFSVIIFYHSNFPTQNTHKNFFFTLLKPLVCSLPHLFVHQHTQLAITSPPFHPRFHHFWSSFVWPFLSLLVWKKNPVHIAYIYLYISPLCYFCTRRAAHWLRWRFDQED